MVKYFRAFNHRSYNSWLYFEYDELPSTLKYQSLPCHLIQSEYFPIFLHSSASFPRSLYFLNNKNTKNGRNLHV